ncbi:hypothetical protein HX799_01210 [Pseudomonas tolaasii]|uniref:hypothetical protein n=1 Tax=Pseudomonas tolaasii TaxID=29442 RepID=UPI0015A0D835|nr:hypothetical protein [Pseudomonas tolaasii]NWC26365.1 hypothetical protein [Pseudomonas tolaasii]NWC49775.1 hypothetical protein [Pseudomonas tolaasii]NWE63707.1 hypothetical protein [Pseudomonas tolaasii]
MDGLTKLLLTKYAPHKLQESLQASVETTKSKASQVQRPISKSALEALQEVLGMVVIMSSNDYTESVIFKALREFNTQHPELMSRSFTLPVSQQGIPVGSWVFVTSQEND